MANYLKIALDRQAQRIASVPGFVTGMPKLFQYDVKDLIIQVVDPAQTTVSGGSGIAYTFPDFTGLAMRVTLGDTPIGNASTTILAQNTNLVWNAANSNVTGNNGGYFSGSLDLTSSNLVTYLGITAGKSAYIEFAIRESGVTKPVMQDQISVSAVVDTGAASTPSSPTLYMTLAEAKAMFLQKAGTRGDQKIFLSQDLTKASLLYLDNTGTLRSDPLNPVPAPAD
jgi:hypothetical protein